MELFVHAMTDSSSAGADPNRINPGKKILIFFPMIPFPLRQHGISIRYFPILQHLSRDHTLDLVLFHPRLEVEGRVEVLRRICRNVSVFQDPRYSPHGIFQRFSTNAKYGVPWAPPFSLVAHGGFDIERIIREQAGKDRYDVLLWVGAFLLPHLVSALPMKTVDKVFVDFIDSPSLIRKRWKSGSNRHEFAHRYELWKTIRWEGEVIRKMDETIYISDVDARTVPEAMTPGKRRRVIPNGIDFGTYTSGKAGGIASPNIGFLGNMAYHPNVEAVHWLHREVFLPLKEKTHALSLSIIGRDPLEPILELGEQQGVGVTGDVEDIWPYVNAVDIFVFPLWTGTGVKNKILESMFAARPVITTPIGNEGIDAVDGRDILICRDPDQFRKETARLLDSPEERRRIGESGRDFVRQRFLWPPILEAFEEIVTGRRNHPPAERSPV